MTMIVILLLNVCIRDNRKVNKEKAKWKVLYKFEKRMPNLRCAQVLVNVTGNGCTKLGVLDIVIDINKIINHFHLYEYVSLASLP